MGTYLTSSEANRKMRALGAVLMAISLIGFCFLFSGCSTEVKGGKATHDTGTIVASAPTTQQSDRDFLIELPTPYGKLIYRKGDSALSNVGQDYRHEYDTVDTEQASGKTNTGQNFSIGQAKEGMLGAFSVVAEQIPYKNAWMLSLAFAALAAAAWFLFKDIAVTILFGICAVVSFLNPGLMVWVGVAVGLFAAYKIYRRTSAEKADLKSKFADVVAGTKRALSVLPPDLKERAKVEMEAEQDHSTKVAVAVAKVKKV